LQARHEEKPPNVKAAIYRRYGSPDVVQLEDVPTPIPKDNEVLIKVHATTVCATDALVRKGEYWMFRLFLGLLKPRKPITGGVEFSGRVVEVGKSVSRFKVGDLVFGWPGKGKGTHAQYVCTSELGALDLLPANVSLDEAASIFCGGMTALVFLKKAGIRPGQNVLIYGASGAVGVFAVQLAKHFGARVTGVCGPSNQELVKSLGADAVIDYTKEDFAKAGRVYDVIVDTVGKSGFARSMQALKRGGTYVLIAGAFLPTPERVWASITGAARIVSPLAGATVGNLEPHVRFLKELLESGKLKTVVSRRYPFAQIREAHAHVETGHKVGSILVLIEDSD
jgi:NADPH:quinone reductase-like Zn-dependent oxidoreductase